VRDGKKKKKNQFRKNEYMAARRVESKGDGDEGGEEGTRQLLLHNMCCRQMVVNYVLRLLHRSCTFALE